MICGPCKVVQHHECANLIDTYGNPRPSNVRANWCDCQHGSRKNVARDAPTNRNGVVTSPSGVIQIPG